MRTNVAVTRTDLKTHEGAPAVHLTPLKELRRSVLSALLWEDTFYESGKALAQRVATLVPLVKPEDVAALAIEARDRMYLRHVPLYLVRQLARINQQGRLVAETLAHVIQRPDELAEYVAMYWDGKASTPRAEPLSAGSKRGLARAFCKFSAYQLAKYDRDGLVKLRDVLRLVHAKPKDKAQGDTWAKLIKRELDAPDTWEVQLSAGKNKRETFERLLRDKKLGALAFLRNLRNMVEVDVDPVLIRERFTGPLERVLPFRFLAAARHAPAYAADIDAAMLRVTNDLPKLMGRTIVLVDVSGSMDQPLSQKSDMKRIDAAAGLAVLVRELADCRVFTFSNRLVEVPNFHGLALVRGIVDSQSHQGTYLGAALEALNKAASAERLIVVTDEQSHDRVSDPVAEQGYVINVGTYQHGVGYGRWIHIDGWSERILDFMREYESES